MGQKVCCMKQAELPNEPKRIIPCDSNCSTPASSTSRINARREQQSLSSPATRKLPGAAEPWWTLERCLMDSPEVNLYRSVNNINIGGGDDGLKFVKRYCKKIDLSSPDLNTDFFTPPSLSFSSDKLGLDEEEEGSCGGSTSIGGKVKKRVSFKLPEEADAREMFEEYRG